MNAVLEKLGLHKIEAELYEVLVMNGALSVARLAEKAGLYRPQVYAYLPKLLAKGLVAESRQGKRTVYVAESPRQLEKLVDKLRSEVAEHIPEFMQLYSTSHTKPGIKYFEGEHGIRHVYEDLLRSCKKGDIFYRYESLRNYRVVRKYIPNEYRERIRDKGEVERLIITNEMTKEQKSNRLGRLIKVVPRKYDLFVYDITQLIYGDKVAFIDFRTETATLIESPMFAEFQRKIFKLLFDKL